MILLRSRDSLAAIFKRLEALAMTPGLFDFGEVAGKFLLLVVLQHIIYSSIQIFIMPKIKAYRGGDTKTFDKAVWDKLPADKYGWKLQSEEPDEVKNLKQSTAVTAGSAKTQKTDEGKNDGKTRSGQLKVVDVINKIKEAKTKAEVDEIVKGDKRPTVATAAAARKKEL